MYQFECLSTPTGAALADCAAGQWVLVEQGLNYAETAQLSGAVIFVWAVAATIRYVLTLMMNRG